MTLTQRALIGVGVLGLCLAAAGGLLMTMEWDAPDGDTGSVEVSPTQRPDDAPPNIVVMLADDAGYADFGLSGSKHFATPRIDRLAREGVRFTNAYVTAPVCSPSRAGLLSGRYQQRFGHEANPPVRGENAGMPTHVRTLARRLDYVGYTSAVFGKWHLGSAAKFHPLERGFAHFYGFLAGERSYFTSDEKGPKALRIGKNPVQEERFDYLTDAIGRRAARWIGEHAAQPFFVYVAYSAVHMPLEARPKDVDAQPKELKGKRRKLAAMTSALDRSIGVVLDTIERNGLEDDTIVFFLNDNGAGKKNHGSNAPFRSGKGRVYEGGIRVPYVVKYPGVTEAGGTFDGAVSALDIAATAVAAAGMKAPELDGVDLAPFLDGTRDGDPHPVLYWRLGSSWAIRHGDLKLLSDKGNPVELYDLAADPGEQADLAASQPDKVADLQMRWDAWNAQLVEPAFQSNTEKRKANKAKKDDQSE